MNEYSDRNAEGKRQQQVHVNCDDYKVCHNKEGRIGKQGLGEEHEAWLCPESRLPPISVVHEEVDVDERPHQDLHQSCGDIESNWIVSFQDLLFTAVFRHVFAICSRNKE